MSESVLRVLFVDDDPMILDVLRLLLARDPYEVHTARSPADARELLGRLAFDVLVVDAHMPMTSGVELLLEVRERHPEIVRIMLTGSGAVDTAMLAVNEGAVFRFLVKPPDPVALRKAIADSFELAIKNRKLANLRRVALEQQALIQELYPEQGGDPSKAKAGRDDALPAVLTELLSPRELEVALGVVRGGDADEVARLLGVSPHTVRTHLKAVFRKLEVHSQAALVSRLYGLGVRPQ